MSVLPSLNTLLSLLSFLTVVFALVRVGAAAFSANQDQDQDAHQHRQGYRLGLSSRDEKRLVRPPVYSHGHGHGHGQEQGQGEGERRPSSWHFAKAALPAAHLLQLQLTGGSSGPGGTPSGASAGNGYGYGYALPIPMSLVRFGPPSSNANANANANSNSGDFSSFAQALRSSFRFGFGSPSSSSASEQNEKNGKSEKEMQYVGGHDLVRMPATTWTGVRRPGLLFRPPSPYPETDPNQPLSMAKLIMSRHQNPRRPNRPTVVRRPPGLPTSPSARSRLVEEV